MCYSVMVETDLKRLAEFHGATIDFNDLLERLRQKASGDLSIKIPKAFQASLESLLRNGSLTPKDSTLAHHCMETWEETNRLDQERLQLKITAQDAKLKSIEHKLSLKASITGEKNRETANRVLEKLRRDLELLTKKPTSIFLDANIYQYSWAPLVITNPETPDIQPIIRFHRYQVRPRGSLVEPPSHINMFNARLDSLATRKTWNPLFMRRHGALSLRGFYEWVPDPNTGQSRVIRFTEEKGQNFWVPALHESWVDPEQKRPGINSFAILTTDPPREIVAAGHDRCPIVIGDKDLKTWLAAKDQDHILGLLQKPHALHFKGEWAKPA